MHYGAESRVGLKLHHGMSHVLSAVDVIHEAVPLSLIETELRCLEGEPFVPQEES